MATRKTTGKAAESANQMWGGRFASGPDAIMAAINTSIDVDRRMYAQDIAGSLAHVAMLAKRGIVSRSDAARISKGLREIETEITEGRFVFKTALEDIHMNVEARLAELIGRPAGRLHTGRSRNDQVATDFRLWVRDAIDHLQRAARDLQAALIEKAEAHAATIMPGFTHLQPAQPITFGHHMLAYVEMIGRDRGRFADARARLNESPLGAAALAGTSYPIDCFMTARALGFARPMANSLDAVGSRDFALEFLAAGSILAIHLSRLAEELVIWTTPQFGFVRLSDGFTTGSSIMPQKRNADAAELVRAKSGTLIGAFVTLATVMKGLPMTYGKDMQDDKPPVFAAADALELALAAMTGMIRDMRVNEEAMKRSAALGYLTATDLADWLVRERGLPFREAHHVAGAVVAAAEKRGVGLDVLTPAELKAIDPRLGAEARKVMALERSVAARASYGGTAPANVRRAAREARRRFLKGMP